MVGYIRLGKHTAVLAMSAMKKKLRYIHVQAYACVLFEDMRLCFYFSYVLTCVCVVCVCVFRLLI